MRRRKKACFALPCNDLYVPLFKAFLRSLIDVHQGRFDYRIYVFHDETLSMQNRRELREIYSKIIFHPVDREKYRRVGKEIIKFCSIECFGLHRYGETKVISIDADCLCISPVDELVELDVDLGMPKERQRPDMYSSGVMVIGKKYLNDRTYNELLTADYSYIKMFGNDMKLYNCYFKCRITQIDYMFDVVNTEVHYLEGDGRRFEDIVFLHIINKPFETGFRTKLGPDLYDLWMKYHVIDYPEMSGVYK